MKIVLRFLVVGCFIGMAACANLKTPVPASPSQPAATAIQTIAPTVSPLPTPSPTFAPFLSWSKDIQADITFLGKYSGTWSPTADELLLLSRDYSVQSWVSLKKAGPPDFDATTLLKLNLDPFLADVSWSPDGNNIAFLAPLPHSSTEIDGEVTLWDMDRNGQSIRPLKNGPINRAQYLPSAYILGWIDNTTVVYAFPSGTCFAYIEGIDISNAKSKFGVEVTCGVKPPHKQYIPFPDATQSGFFVFDAARFDPSYENSYDPPYLLSLDNRPGYVFQDWVPGTDTILLVLEDFTGKDPFTDVPGTSLSIWDPVTHKVEPILPNAVWGRVAAGNRLIAYITFGPAHLDAGGKPVEFNYTPDAIGLPLYLNLYDLQDQKVVFSSDVVYAKTPDADLSPSKMLNYLAPLASFSPDGRYLSFGTVDADRVLQLQVLDLGTRQVVYTLPTDNSSLPNERVGSDLLTWSPDSTRLLYRDGRGNPVILYVKTGRSLLLTSDGGFRVDNPSWSFDGRYLLVSYLDSFDYPNMYQQPESAVINIP